MQGTNVSTFNDTLKNCKTHWHQLKDWCDQHLIFVPKYLQSLAWIWCLCNIDGHILFSEFHYELTADATRCCKSGITQGNHSAGTKASETFADALRQGCAFGTATRSHCDILDVASRKHPATICTECSANFKIAIGNIGFTAYIESILQKFSSARIYWVDRNYESWLSSHPPRSYVPSKLKLMVYWGNLIIWGNLTHSSTGYRPTGSSEPIRLSNSHCSSCNFSNVDFNFFCLVRQHSSLCNSSRFFMHFSNCLRFCILKNKITNTIPKFF